MWWHSYQSADEYKEYVDSIYGNIWPDEIYVAASHFQEDNLNVFVSAIMNQGYNREELYSDYEAFLVRLSKDVDSVGSKQ